MKRINTLGEKYTEPQVLWNVLQRLCVALEAKKNYLSLKDLET